VNDSIHNLYDTFVPRYPPRPLSKIAGGERPDAVVAQLFPDLRAEVRTVCYFDTRVGEKDPMNAAPGPPRGTTMRAGPRWRMTPGRIRSAGQSNHNRHDLFHRKVRSKARNVLDTVLQNRHPCVGIA